VHAGLGADAASRAASLKPVLGAAAYPIGAVLAAATSDSWSVTVEVDGAVVHDGAPVLMVAICNGRTIGGGTELCPVADPGDGLADVLVVTAVDVTARIAFGNDLRKGEHLARPDVSYARGRAVSVRGEPMDYNVDGEIVELVEASTYTVVPAAWTLRCPGAASPVRQAT
jgi:diacylglycerol kinase family enzyme